MGIKVLILQACLIAGEDIGKAVAVGERPEVSKEDALYLARAGRALYLNKEDDPTKGLSTATDADVRAVKLQANAIADAADAASQPQNMASIIASAVQQGIEAGMAAALAKPAATAG